MASKIWIIVAMWFTWMITTIVLTFKDPKDAPAFGILVAIMIGIMTIKILRMN